MSDSDRPTTPPPNVSLTESEVVPGGPVFQRLEESTGPPPSPWRKNSVPLTALVLLVGLAIMTSLDWRSWIEEELVQPEFAFNRAFFRALDDERLAVDLQIDVTNPNSFGVQILNYTVRFSVDGVEVVHQRVDRVVDFPGAETGGLLVPLRFPWGEVLSLMERHAAAGELPRTVPYHVEGVTTIAVPGRSISVPFEYDGEFPVVVPPLVLPCDFGISSSGVTEVRIEVDLCVKNPNARPIGVNDVRYEVRVNDRTLVEAELGEDLNIRPRSQQTVAVVGTLTNEAAGRRLMAAVLGVRTEIEVRVIGSAELDTGIGVVPFHFDSAESIQPYASP